MSDIKKFTIATARLAKETTALLTLVEELLNENSELRIANKQLKTCCNSWERKFKEYSGEVFHLQKKEEANE